MQRKVTYRISESDAGQTIEEFLKQRGCSRKLLRRLKQMPDGICLGDQGVRKTRRLQAGDQLTICVRDETPSPNTEPEPIPLSIVYEDEDLIVLDKPAGLAVHSSMGHHTHTVANALAYHLGGAEDPYVCRIMNRLDRNTSGLMIAAKNVISAGILAQMDVERMYLALADGLVPEKGTIQAPIARKDGSILERCVHETKGKPAVTHFRRLAFDGSLSLVMIKLETGRTHQIRVHMKYLGHPLPGDFLYHPDFSRIGRQALHAYRLDFRHPLKPQRLSLTAAIPEDFCRAFHGEIPPIPSFWT